MFALINASLAHDVGHNARNNTFHINTESELALRFNSQSVLENYHAHFLVTALKNEDCNVLKGMSREE